jgi:hypothetical protein
MQVKHKDYRKLWLISLGWAIFLFLCIDLIWLFSFGQFYEALHKPFWLDERNSLENNVRNASFLDLIINGAKGQGSPAPLDYIFLKGLYYLKSVTNGWGIIDEVYLRFVALFSTLFTAISVLVLFAIRISRDKNVRASTKACQYVLLSFVPFVFLFSRYVYYYAAESRPYALWNALYLFVLALTFIKDRYLWLFILALTSLALTATASIYQIGTLAFSYLIVGYLQNRSFRTILLETSKVFILPLLVAFYYCLKVQPWHEPYLVAEWQEYLHLWTHKFKIIFMMGISIGLCWLKKENRKFAIAPLGFLFLYLAGPLTFWITKMKGFFYTDRQYVYYDLTNAVFLLTMIQILPSYLNQIRKRAYYYAVVFLCIVIGFSFTFQSKINKKISETIEQAFWIYKNPSVLKTPLHSSSDLP